MLLPLPCPLRAKRHGFGMGGREVALLSRSVVISLQSGEVTTYLAIRQLEKKFANSNNTTRAFPLAVLEGRELRVKLYLRSLLLLYDMQLIKLH